MAKPWATSHIATVAAGLGIDHRISGDVKEKLVSLLEDRLKDIGREMEDKTLEADPERKTLGDPVRTRLGFNRTRGMMIDNVGRVDSVGAAAVVAANECPSPAKTKSKTFSNRNAFFINLMLGVKN